MSASEQCVRAPAALPRPTALAGDRPASTRALARRALVFNPRRHDVQQADVSLLVWLGVRGTLRRLCQPRWRRVPSRFLPSASTSHGFESLDDLDDDSNEDLFIGAAGVEIRGLSL